MTSRSCNRSHVVSRGLLTGVLVASAGLLAACSTSEPGAAPASTATVAEPVNGETMNGETMSGTALIAALDASAEDGFVCTVGENTAVAWFPSKDAASDGGMYDSFFANWVDSEKRGLEIVTLGGVSYARWTAGAEAAGSDARQALVRKLDGAWGTWGQPDTITLEELPTAPSGCLAWTSIEGFSDVRRDEDGRWAFNAELAGHDELPASHGVMETANDKAVSFVVKPAKPSSVSELVNVGFSRPEFFPERVPARVVELTQDEYFTLVGG